MGIAAQKGPLLTYGSRPPLGNSNENPNAAPNLFYGGSAIFDPRGGYNNTLWGALGWYGGQAPLTVDQVPSTIATNNIAAAQVPVAATPLTLVSASGAGITVITSSTAITLYPKLTTLTSGLIIDSAPGLQSFGPSSHPRLNFYDPTLSISRTVRITSAGNDSAATATIAGYDIYGFPMTETQTLTNASVTAGKKAFKIITSITPAGTLSGSNVSVGTGDLYGFAIRADRFAHVEIWWNNAAITANTGFTAADTTSPATATTGDVRGTYAVQSASDGTKRLQIYVQPLVNNIQSNMTTGLFGVTQV